MADKPTCPPEKERKEGLFRRAEDWERLTRLEFIVEELARDNERRDLRIDKMVETQKKQGETQDKMLRYARDIRMIAIGGGVVLMLKMLGVQKILPVLMSLFMAGI